MRNVWSGRESDDFIRRSESRHPNDWRSDEVIIVSVNMLVHVVISVFGVVVTFVELRILNVVLLLIFWVRLLPVNSELPALFETQRASIDIAHVWVLSCVSIFMLLQILRKSEFLLTMLAFELLLLVVSKHMSLKTELCWEYLLAAIIVADEPLYLL